MKTLTISVNDEYADAIVITLIGGAGTSGINIYGGVAFEIEDGMELVQESDGRLRRLVE